MKLGIKQYLVFLKFGIIKLYLKDDYQLRIIYISVPYLVSSANAGVRPRVTCWRVSFSESLRAKFSLWNLALPQHTQCRCTSLAPRPTLIHPGHCVHTLSEKLWVGPFGCFRCLFAFHAFVEFACNKVQQQYSQTVHLYSCIIINIT